MVDKIINTKSVKDSDIVILGANYDRTSSFGKGSDKGPESIIDCLDTQIEIYERYTRSEPAKELKIAYKSLGDLNELSPKSMISKLEKVYHYAKDKMKKDGFLITLGGEHSITAGILRGLRNRFVRPVTVFQIDAHCDLRDSDADFNEKPWGAYAHCCVMRRAFDMGFDAVQVGIRAYSEEESDFMVKNSDRILTWEWGGKNHIPSIESVVDSVLSEEVYLTLDVDGIDPAYMPATGTPVQGGLEWNYTFELISELFKRKKVIGADIVEVAPRKGDNLTQYGAAQLLYNIIANYMVNSRKDGGK